MRLPWPFRFLQRVPADARARALRARGRRRSANAATGASGARFRRSKRSWDRHRWSRRTAPFAADLGAGHAPPPMLAPLGHGKGLDAPSGIVAGLARPVQRAAGGSPRPLAPRRGASNTTVQASPTEPVPGEGEPAPAPIAARTERARAQHRDARPSFTRLSSVRRSSWRG